MSKPRKSIRLILNAMLWLVVVLYVYQPSWPDGKTNQTILLHSDEIEADFLKKLSDSLKISQVFSASELEQKIKNSSDFLNKTHNVHIAGQDFKMLLMSRLVNKKLIWHPYFKKDMIQDCQWQGILRKGETQEISGDIELLKPQLLSLRYGNKTLDSQQLKAGFNGFKLRFSVFSLGETALSVFLGENEIQKIHFFAQKAKPMSILMLLENADFESKTLADWLGKNGHQVRVLTTVAKEKQNTLTINSESEKTPDLVIATPAGVSHDLLKKAVQAGKNVLLLNFSNPESEIKMINQTLGCSFKINQISSEKSIQVGQDLSAFPFEISEKNNQKKVDDLPLAVQKVKNKIGISFLNETFHLLLSGDSLAYRKTWSGVFDMLQPTYKNNLTIEAPIAKHQFSEFTLNNLEKKISEIIVSNDTFSVNPSPINDFSMISTLKTNDSGWQKINDSTSIFVEDTLSDFYKNHHFKNFIKSYNQEDNVNFEISMPSNKQYIKDWIWLLALLIIFTILWLEPKL